MKKRFISNLWLKICALLFAALIWLAVTNAIDPSITKTISNIPIQVTKDTILLRQNKVYTVNSASNVASVKVKGKRSIVENLMPEDFEATAPVDEMSIVNALPVYVTIKNSRYRDNLEILDKTNSVSISIEDVLKKTYDVTVEYSGEIPDGYYCDGAELSSNKIEITAPESIHNLINRVVVPADLTDAKDDFVIRTAPKLYKADGEEILNTGNITFSKSKIRASITVLKIKEVGLEFKTVGTPADGYECTTAIGDPEKLQMVGHANVIDNLEKVTISSATMDIEGARGNIEKSIDITPYLPSGVKLLDTESPLVDVTAVIESFESRKYTITTDDIKMTNIPEKYAVSPAGEQNVTFTLQGLEDKLDEFDIDSIDASVDLSDAQEGENEVEVKLNLPTGIKLEKKITINVTIVNKKTVTHKEEATD